MKNEECILPPSGWLYSSFFILHFGNAVILHSTFFILHFFYETNFNITDFCLDECRGYGTINRKGK